MSNEQTYHFEPTIRKPSVARIKRDRPPLQWVGLLKPLAGKTTKTFRIDDDQVILGREIGVDVHLSDDSASRQHVRITRRGEEFFLEDLQSSNGTQVEGLPVVSCVLHDGDTIQIGQSLFYFDRLLEWIPNQKEQPHE